MSEEEMEKSSRLFGFIADETTFMGTYTFKIEPKETRIKGEISRSMDLEVSPIIHLASGVFFFRNNQVELHFQPKEKIPSDASFEEMLQDPSFGEAILDLNDIKRFLLSFSDGDSRHFATLLRPLDFLDFESLASVDFSPSGHQVALTIYTGAKNEGLLGPNGEKGLETITVVYDIFQKKFLMNYFVGEAAQQDDIVLFDDWVACTTRNLQTHRNSFVKVFPLREKHFRKPLLESVPHSFARHYQENKDKLIERVELEQIDLFEEKRVVNSVSRKPFEDSAK